MWNMNRETLLGEPRTTNSAESWHRALQLIFTNPHPGVPAFLETLMKEWLKIKALIDQLSMGKKIKKTMKISEVQREQRIKSTVERCGSFVTWIDYLSAMADATKKT